MRKRVAAAFWLMLALPAAADTVTGARFAEPTQRYAHGVFGETGEWGALQIGVRQAGGARRTLSFRLPQDRVFEDTAPRVADVTGDGAPDVVLVETDIARGAMLAVYGPDGRLAATRPVGQTHRWLAPLAIGDLDGDGRVEIAYVDRPHLTRELVIVRYERGTLREVARLGGVTNHRFGDATISGGIRDCGQGAEMVLADADWRRVMAVRLADGRLMARPLGPMRGAASLKDALACKG